MNDAIRDRKPLKRDCCHCIDFATCKGKDEDCYGRRIINNSPMVMTNREWLNSLSDEDLALWLCDCLNGTGLSYIKLRYSISTVGLAEWMEEKHDAI